MRALEALVFLAALATAAEVLPHPLGNNSVNRQSALTIAPGEIELAYLMDLAEIPALLAAQEADRDQSGDTSHEEWEAHTRRWAMEVMPRLSLRLDGSPLPLQLRSQRFQLLPGEAGLSTLRLEAVFSVAIGAIEAGGRLEYRDDHRPERSGWKEIWIRPADGARVEQATVPQVDRSKRLTDFSLPLTASAPNELAASAVILVPAPSAAAAVSEAENARRRAPAVPAAGAGPSLQAPATPEREPIAAVMPGGTQPAGERDSSWSRAAWVFFKLGVHHIATGWDHLVFLFGLLLLSQSALELIKVVTAFTLAHSMTLALAAAGLVTPPGEIIEPAIALTIAYVGLIGLVWRRSRHGAWLALLFGLVHGFGFAGALAESLAEQPPSQRHWLVSLASFNLGIEAFQVLLVCAFVPLMRVAARASWSSAAHRGASLAVLVAGVGWFLSRTLPWLA